MNISNLESQVVTLAEQAGQLICQFYKQDTEPVKKKDGSPVTMADQQSHLLLKKTLEKLTPHIPIISEEDEDSWTIKSPLYWLIDPLDGTKGFISKTGEFCVCIALMQDDYPILGIIHIPLTQETFYGYEGQAWRQHKGEKTRLHTRPFSKNGLTLLMGGHGKKHKEKENFFLKAYPIEKIEIISSAIKFTRIAAGTADFYIRFEGCREWDTAAGQALIEAAGGTMTNLDGSRFLYGKPGFLNKEFIVFGQRP